MSLRFSKKVENFVCENCNFLVSGDGFTNHCPQCLWSKHVDIYPGDRSCVCRGLMKPVGSILKKQQYFVEQKCLKCGSIHINHLAKNDNFSILIHLKV